MRRLGSGQSVVFYAPTEVEESIRGLNGRSTPMSPIEVLDVLSWSITQTCQSIRAAVPLWAVQGVAYHHRATQWSRLTALESLESDSDFEGLDSMLEVESLSLEQRYGIERSTFSKMLSTSEELVGKWQKELVAIRAKCKDFRAYDFQSSALTQEQERELSPEMEQERQEEKPPRLLPLQHNFHPAIRRYISTGTIDPQSPALVDAFKSLKATSAKECIEETAWPEDVLISLDQSRTVQLAKADHQDFYLRPVNWILTSKMGGTFPLIIISPFEAQQCLPMVRATGSKVCLHVYSARVEASVKPFDKLNFATIPGPIGLRQSWSHIRLLNLFAGQIYLDSCEEYESLCGFLGLITVPPPEGITVAADGFIEPSHRRRITASSSLTAPFESSPTELLTRLINMRRQGGVSKYSHIGRILNKELLKRTDFAGTQQNGTF